MAKVKGTVNTDASGGGWSPEPMPDFYRPEEPVGRPTLPPPPDLPDATRRHQVVQADVPDAAAGQWAAVPVDDRTIPRQSLLTQQQASPAPVSTPAPAAAPVQTPAATPAAAPAPAATTEPSVRQRAGTRRTRRARLRVSRVDPWSVMKTSFLFSIAFGVMFLISTYVVWSVIGASGLLEAVNGILQQVLANPNDQEAIRIENFVNTNKVMGIAALLAVANVVILTALGTLTAFLYNLSANILGGLELTLAED